MCSDTWGVKSHLEPFVKLEMYDFQKFSSDKDIFTMNRISITGPRICQHPSTALILILYMYFCMFFL